MENCKIDFRIINGKTIIESYFLPAKRNLYVKKRITEPLEKELISFVNNCHEYKNILLKDGFGTITVIDSELHSISYTQNE